MSLSNYLPVINELMTLIDGLTNSINSLNDSISHILLWISGAIMITYGLYKL